MDWSTLVNRDATRISRRLFADEALYQRELKTIFHTRWLFLGHSSQLANVGDYFTTTMGEVPVIVSRAEDGKIYGYINSCSHRGLPVCRVDRGNDSGFTCPYHNWRYNLKGELSATPKADILGPTFNKQEFGLRSLALIDEYKGLVFGCFDTPELSLEAFLGDMRYYLDCMLDRTPAGTEVLGAPHKWLINANWKMPAENQTGDQYHAPLLHGSFITDDFVNYQRNGTGFNYSVDQGHGGSIVLLPPESPDTERILGLETLIEFEQQVLDYYLSVQQDVEQRLGSVRARIRPLNFNVFPNFSLIWPMYSIRVAHPRGAGKTEIWSWCLIDRDAPDYVKSAAKRTYARAFGPAGGIEMEDGEAWAQQHKGSSIELLFDQTYPYGTMLGTEGSHEELPGIVGPALSDHHIRRFYLRWLDCMKQGGAHV